VLRVGSERIELAEGCLRCGRCRAACPTGALRVEGFEASLRRRAERNEPVYVDCWKVPPSRSPGEALRVPCLGGVAPHDLFHWYLDGGGRALALLDRGWCSGCSAGSAAAHPAAEALDAVRRLFSQLGVPEDELPRLEKRPLPAAEMPASIPDPLAARTLDRRAFFAGMTRSALRAASALRGSAPRASRPAPRRAWTMAAEGAPRASLLARAAELAESNGRTLPAELFPSIRVSGACRNHRVCAAICPTGALQRYECENTSGIRFDPRACIACGDCTRACPEHAIVLAPRADAVPPNAPAELTRWTRRLCVRCDEEFASGGEDEHCPACRKDLALFASVFPIGSQHS
jgi:ferredoxin